MRPLRESGLRLTVPRDFVASRLATLTQRSWLLPLALLAAAAAVRFRGLDAQSLWLDEGMSVYFVNLGLDRLWEITFAQEPNPPLYYLLLWGWVHLWGQGEIALRSLSAILGTLAVLPAYLLARDLGGPRAGLLAGLATLGSPFLLWYSQEARSFALLSATSAAFLYLTHRALQSPSQRVLLAWVAFGILTLYSHIYGAFAFSAGALTLLAAGRARLLTRVAAVAVPTAFFAPWAFATLQQSAAARGWRAPVGPEELITRALATVTHHDVLTGLVGWIAIGLLVGAALWGVHTAPPRARLLLGLAICLPLGFAYGLSFFKPIFAERYIIPIAIPIYIAASLGIAAAGRQSLFLSATAALAVGILLIAALFAFDEPRFEKENFRAAAQRVAASAGPNDAIVFVAEFAQRPFEYYYGQGPGRLIGFFGDHRNPASVLEPLAQAAPTIWLVESHAERYDPDRQVRGWLQSHYPLVTEAYPQGINIRAFRTQYMRPPATPPSPPMASFGELQLLGAAFPPSIAARDEHLHPPSGWLPVELTWSLSGATTTDFRLILELVDARGVWGRSLERSGDLFHQHPTSTWQVGPTMLEAADLNLNPNTPAGKYILQLAVVDGAGNGVASSPAGPIRLGEVEIRA